MLDFIILLSLYLTANAQRSIYPSELYDAINGNPMSLINDMLPLGTGGNKTYKDRFIPIKDLPNITEIFDYKISDHYNHHDMLDFHVITQKANNITRRWKYEDQDDSGWAQNVFSWRYIEDDKKQTLSRINIQWLMHSRFFVSRVLRQREPIRTDKRFQLGYLFNRLRRLSYEQLKVVSTATYYGDYAYRSVDVLMRFYEQVVRFDVDIRDTIDLIKATYVIPASFDKINK